MMAERPQRPPRHTTTQAAELMRQRDRARDIAVALEQRLAVVERLADDWEMQAHEAMQGWGMPRQNWRHWSFVEALLEALEDERGVMFEADRTSQPTGLGNQEGERDGKQGGVHPVRTREAAEGPDGRGVHGGSGVLDRSGPDPRRQLPDGVGRGLTGGTGADVPAPVPHPAATDPSDGGGGRG